MIHSPANDLSKEISVGMGQAVVTREPARLTAILGSCVAIALYAPRLRLGMLGHVVLPNCNGSSIASPAKYADTAVPHMLAVMQAHGARPGELIAKLAGGACLFGGGQFMDIGQSNARVAVAALEAAHVRIAARDVAGTMGRRICFDLATGGLTVASPGKPSQTI